MFKTIRFKLTAIYSLVIIVFSLTLVLMFNIYLNSYFQRDPVIEVNTFQTPFGRFRQFNNLNNEEANLIRNYRLNDLKNIQTLSLISVIPITILSFIIGYYISGVFLKPIDDLRLKIERLKIERLGEKLEKVSDDEVGKLIDSFNDMSVRLKSAFESQTRFIQDASHELKTPLAIIQLNLDTILDDKSASKDDLKSAITNSLNGIKRINTLTEDLLELSITNSFRREEVSLKKLILEQIDILKPEAKRKNVKLVFNKDDNNDIKYLVNEHKFGRAIFNLIENGIKFSKENDGEVNINLELLDKSIVIEVIDNGKGFDVNEKDKIFDRFYQIDKSRSNKGFGLGLSIVKKIVEEHSGTISISREDNLTKFKIILPKL